MKLLAKILLGLWACGSVFAAGRLYNPVHPSWSPDGKTIIYEAGPQGDCQIVALSMESLEIVPLTRGAHTLVARDHIAFLRMGADLIELMVMSHTGGSPRPLAEVRGAPTLLTWTPDDRIGFVSATEPGSFDVYLADLSGKLERVLQSISNSFSGRHMRWKRDCQSTSSRRSSTKSR